MTDTSEDTLCKWLDEIDAVYGNLKPYIDAEGLRGFLCAQHADLTAATERAAQLSLIHI